MLRKRRHTIPPGWNEVIHTRTTHFDNVNVTTEDVQILQHREQHGRIRVAFTNAAGITRIRTVTFPS